MGIIVIAALLGLIPAFIAQSKGRSFAGWWVYGFLLFIVAIIHVLIIPAKNSNIIEISSSDLRDCPFCAEPIKRQASKCKHCGSEVEPAPMLPSLSDSSVGDGTKIEWKRVLVLVLAIGITVFIIKNFG
ncbi:hypothetical protein [Serratia sp. MYb239]|uniref:hypothetical protein n=1 Tax=Serratia sp. MYb239 TaxID=2033438 RepID=UPI001F2C249F|nr:hypothetical protein [Serratia sp. MYb239]